MAMAPPFIYLAKLFAADFLAHAGTGMCLHIYGKLACLPLTTD